ncbi:MAG: shikimate dehydrogenase family protein [Candidatus Dormibacterales bacterium]
MRSERQLRLFLLGHEISYSSSPAMQNAAFRAVGLDWSYELMDVAPRELAAAVGRLRGEEVAGANVTVPHKRTVMDQLDELDPEALKARAVNTIVNRNGKLTGSNTDVAAIRAALDELGVSATGARAVILGSGGAARASAVALEGAHITFVSRHPSDADLPGRQIAWDDPALPATTRSADLLVNATPLGRRDEMPVRPAALPQAGAVIDLVYVTGGTPLVRKARSVGLRVTDGWTILLGQGARSFEIWTGLKAPVDAMRETLHP